MKDKITKLQTVANTQREDVVEFLREQLKIAEDPERNVTGCLCLFTYSPRNKEESQQDNYFDAAIGLNRIDCMWYAMKIVMRSLGQKEG